MAAPTRARAALTERLRQARRDADLTGVTLAARIGAGWAQPKVSKIESGRQLPTEQDVRDWATATATDVDELLALLARAHHEYTAFRDIFGPSSAGADGRQTDIATTEQSAKLLYGFQPLIVHGLLQTADYARALLHLPGGPAEAGAGEDEIARMVAVRLSRQAILYEPGRDILVLIGETALRNRVASPETMRGQILQVAMLAATTTSTARVGILPLDRPSPMMTLHGWDVRGDVVVIETGSGSLEIADPDEVRRYQRHMELLADMAVIGNAAADLCRNLLAQTG